MRLTKRLSANKRLFFQVMVWTLAFSLLTTQIFYTRFLQDDYYLLGAISNSSLFEFLESVWQGQGGNLWIYGFQGLLLLTSLYSVDTSIIAAWTRVTVSVVALTNYLILK